MNRPYPFATNLLESYIRKLMFKITGVISLTPQHIPQSEIKGIVLLSYISNPFLLKPTEKMSASHTAPWECAEIARLWLIRGYEIDIIEWTNTTFIPKKKYDYIIDIHQNIDRLADILPPTCKKIMHIVSAYWKFQNEAEEQRLKNLTERRGIILKPHRVVSPSRNAEIADIVEGLGNEFTFSTYRFTHKNIFPIPISATTLYEIPDSKDFEKIRRNFLWLGGGGMVHKGLDLVVEVFKEHPEFHLTICGPVSAEKDFEAAYYTELYQTSNIQVLGKIDIRSQEFIHIVKNTVALIYPSCSEGQSGAVVAALHAGLIPLISYESGVSVQDFGTILRTCTKEEIVQVLQETSSLPASALKEKAHAAWQYARSHHTREKFTEQYSAFLDFLLSKK